VRGLNENNKRRKVIRWLLDTKGDIIFLQETFCTEKLAPSLSASWPGCSVHAVTDSPHSRGVSVLFSKKYNVNIIDKHTSSDGRLLLINIELNNKTMTVINVYANNTETKRKGLFKKLEKWVNKYAKYKENIIVAGDMNCCLRRQDRSNDTHLTDKSRNILENVCMNINVKDAWASVTPDPGYTYKDKRHEMKSRLDYIFVNRSVKLCSEDVNISVCPCVPDHNAVIMKMRIYCNTRGPGYWIMNNQLLDNQEFNIEVERIINDVRTKYNNMNHSFVWETIKICIKEMAIKMSVKNARKNKADKECLQKELDHLNLKENEDCVNSRRRKQEIENRLSEMYNKEAQGAQLRSKAKYVETGEVSLKYFKDLEKVHQMNNVIECIEKDDGELVCENESILNECVQFYTCLYTSQRIENDVIDNYVRQTVMPMLTSTEKEICDQEITEKEVYEAVISLKNNKSPGIDGLTPEFYKKHWENLKTPFMCMLKEAYEKNELPTSLNQSVLTLLYKKGDRKLLKNYRPLSLGTYDYKILAFVLAKRLQQVIKSVVHTDQSAYIKGRYIGLNARFIADFYDYCEKYDKEGIILSLDYEKAFDRLEWNYMYKVLEAFNFGPNMIKWIKIMYKQPIIMVKNNGWLSEPIATQRGIRQGCPASALIFILAIELMALNIRANSHIKGIKIGDSERKLAQYADDSTLTLTTIESIGASLDTVNKFCEISGMKLNMQKSEGIWLGPFRNNPKCFNGIKFTNEPIRILGLYIGHDVQKCHDENWLRKLNRVKNCIHVWKSRKLTLFGKVQLLKSLALSKLVYSLSLLHVDKAIVKDITKCFHSFLWNTTDRIKRNTLIARYNVGGINMVDVDCMVQGLKAAWIPRLLRAYESESILNIYLQMYKLDLNIILNGNISKDIMLPDNVWLPLFYQQCITSFNSCKTDKYSVNVHDFLKQPIWCNKLFTFKGKSLCYPNWIHSGFVWVKDFVDNSGNFVTGDYVYQRLICKRNWICEYKTMKKVIKKQSSKFQCMFYAKYENISKQIIITNNDVMNVILDQKCKFFYDILVETKKCRSYVEQYWRKKLGKEMPENVWEKVYMNRIHKLPDNKLREFMYKFFHRLLPNRATLYKWKRVESPICPICSKTENIEHIYFECKCIKPLWEAVGAKMNIDLNWNKIICGYLEDIAVHKIRNLIFTIVMYARYKIWSKSTMTMVRICDMKNIVLQDFNKWNYIIENVNFDTDHNVLKRIWINMGISECIETV